jgi:hypothetical protein
LLVVFICSVIAVLILAVAIRLIKMDRRERGDEEGGWGGGGGGPNDWPALPPAPGGGPIPDTVPEEWVQEVLKPRRIEILIIRPEPPPEEGA